MHKAPKATVGELDVCSPGHPPTHQLMKGAMHKTLFIVFSVPFEALCFYYAYLQEAVFP